jgi:ubiquinone/menaquinone biosynthesis C-methylase UbiE
MKNRIQKAYKNYINKFPQSYDKKNDIITVDKHHYQVSLKTTNTVQYEGNIPSDKIKIV